MDATPVHLARHKESQHHLAFLQDLHPTAPNDLAWQSGGAFVCRSCLRALAKDMDVFMSHDRSYCSRECLPHADVAEDTPKGKASKRWRTLLGGIHVFKAA
eukprot:CAMPEP_0179333336 /NCGR_PEP_ID=MMETSP0797-20121207/65244_1 /TAXON_ID=47934 /ORGANISM="Dinophysis acuminata, Strain DAEP01" /LENGTH=100 /DNA_ID=CAMNT_0021046327 /DNA_START=61 /DNA_END=359 /DNA_ORIENTATION=+